MTSKLTLDAAEATLKVMPYLAQAAEKATREAGTLTAQQAGMLFMLTESPLRGSQIAERWGVSRAAVTEAAQRMEKHGWIRRRRDPADGRSFLFALTAKGERELERFGEVATQSVASRIESLNQSETQALLDVSSRLFEIFSETFE